ncbi:MAG: DHA2 family efflux MFS transporter permease subunit [Chloroflexi bacterium]|nr:DHA2 family efflux MFS transporter permease subunit [Chloroflexota bacterium]
MRPPHDVGFDYRWLIVSVTTVGSFTSLLNQTTVNIGLPKIIATFGVDIQDGQWILTAYMIALSVVIPVSGFMAEKVGMKRLYIVTMALFLAGSFLCSLAWDLPSLVLFRILQGLGGGMVQPLGMAIVYSIMTPLERPRFMAVLGLPMLVAPLLGPTLGGYLVEFVGWRALFEMNIPIGLVGLLLAGLILPRTPARERALLDRPGFILSSIAFPALLLGFTFGARDGWSQWNVDIFLLVGLLCLAGWIMVELIQPEPMLDLRLFSNPIFSLGQALHLVIQLSLFGTQLLLPLFLQTTQGLGALQAGLILMPQGIASFLSMNVSSRLYNHIGPRPMVLAGLAILTFTTWELSHLSLGTSSATITLLAMARGLCMGLSMMPITTAAFNTVPTEKMARATALSSSLMRVFSSFSTAFISTVLHGRSVFHYRTVAATLSPNRPAVLALTSRLVPQLVARGITSAPAQQRATTRVLSAYASQTAMVMAFNDTFLILTLFSVAAALLALFISDPAVEEAKRQQQQD